MIQDDIESRELSALEKECIDKLLTTMSLTGSDFTDTFRILGDCSVKNDNRQEVVDKLL